MYRSITHFDRKDTQISIFSRTHCKCRSKSISGSEAYSPSRKSIGKCRYPTWVCDDQERSIDKLTMYSFDNCGPAVQAFPLFLAESNYQDVTDNSQTAFQKGFNTNLTCFEWLKQHPRNFDAMHKVMTGLGSNDWIRDFPLVDDSVRKISLRKPELSERPFFVDVGGGHGHQCSQLLERYPSLSGHIILQDLSEAVSEIKSINGVKIMAQDFFEKQAIQGTINT